jgi:hypothetical protein
MLQVETLTQTCTACPSQWEGRLVDGRPIYIRFRHGELSIRIGRPDGGIESAINGPVWFEWEADNGLDGEISLDEVFKLSGLRGTGPSFDAWSPRVESP